jgi:outer membrane protein assembly factor BamE (lipoprotein component of BamABCDE complex)
MASAHIEAAGRRCNGFAGLYPRVSPWAGRVEENARMSVSSPNIRFRGRSPGVVAIVLAGAALVLTAGCSRIRDHKGYVVDSTLIDTVQPGVDNRDSVTKTLGRPSFAGEFDRDRTWYYVSRDTRQLAFATPKATAQTILMVKFDPAGNVVSVQKTGMEKIASISPAGGKTPTLGRKRGFFRELFGNIGTVGSGGATSQGGGTTDNPN